MRSHSFKLLSCTLLSTTLLVCGCSSTKPPPRPAPRVETETSLQLQFSDLPHPAVVYIDGQKAGSLAKGSTRFQTTVPTHTLDREKWVEVLIDFGKHPYRFHEYIKLNCGETNSVKLTLAMMALPSFSVSAKRSTEEGTVYAGDEVALELESDGELGQSAIWLAYPLSQGEQDLNTGVSPSRHDERFGLQSWGFLRSEIKTLLGLFKTPATDFVLVPNPTHRSRKIGFGSNVTWHPQQEGVFRVVLLVYKNPVLWSLCYRDVKVADLRPSVWVKPDLWIDAQTLEPSLLFKRVSQDQLNAFLTVDKIHDLLASVTFKTTVDEIAGFDLFQGNTTDAELQLKNVNIQWGDGSGKDISATELQDFPGHHLSHVYRQPGLYTVRITSRDFIGFKKEQQLLVSVAPKPAEPITPEEPEVEPALPPPPPPAPASPRQLVKARTNYDLFQDALRNWCEKLVQYYSKIVTRGTTALGLPMLPDRSGKESGVPYHLGSMFTETIAQKLMARDRQVFERDHAWLNPLRKEWEFCPTNNFECADSIISFQLWKAVVNYDREQEFAYREAQIMGSIRVHDRETGQILGTRRIEERLGDIVIYPRNLQEDRDAITSYSKNFLSYVDSQQDVLKVLEAPARSAPTPVAPTAVPAAASAPTQISEPVQTLEPEQAGKSMLFGDIMKTLKPGGE